jgi:hypothetical protein
MNYIKVLIEDLQEKQAIDITDNYQYKMTKLMIKNDHKLSDCIPRDVSIWSKTESERIMLAKCKANYKREMLSLYPYFTNKKMIVNLRVKV